MSVKVRRGGAETSGARRAKPPSAARPRDPLSLYYVDPGWVGGLDRFEPHLDRARRLGFGGILTPPLYASDPARTDFLALDHDRARASLGEGLSLDAALSTLSGLCRARGLDLFMDFPLLRFSARHPLVQAHPAHFAFQRRRTTAGPVDPRRPQPAEGEARPRLSGQEAAAALLAWTEDRLARLAATGLSGVRFLELGSAPAAFWASLAGAARAGGAPLRVLADLAGLARADALALEACRFEAVTASLAWWDARSPWLVEEHESLRLLAPVLAVVETPAGPRLAERSPSDDPSAAARRMLALAPAVGSGMLAPMGIEYGGSPGGPGPAGWSRLASDDDPPLAQAVMEANSRVRALGRFNGELRALTGPGAPVTALLRADASGLREAEAALLVLINPSLSSAASIEADAVLAGLDFGPFRALDEDQDGFSPLPPGGVRLLTAQRLAAIRFPATGAEGALRAARRPRLVIEGIAPAVDGGDFPVKRVVGDTVEVEADIFADGHEALRAEVRWRALDDPAWRAAPLALIVNDRWGGRFRLDRPGRHVFQVRAWIDRFGGSVRDYNKKLAAGVARAVDLEEAAGLIREAAARGTGPKGSPLRDLAARIEGAPPEERASLVLGPEALALMDALEERPFALESPEQRVDAERLSARFASWYELFPRSQTDDPCRHGRFSDVIARLPAIRRMGFDVLYFPPIHPIGRTHRKGPDNSLSAGPDDPGSPYAIGSSEGGHEAVHPELGTLEDFRQLVRAAAGHGLEIALDFAIQCSPDHPWLTQRPDWFAWRPDGTIKVAENPPKIYEDIVNVDFYAGGAAPDLWLALRDIVLGWVSEGVKTFRVDNPHTKPLPFWEWLIGEVRAGHPEVIFLAEAFTQPKRMYRLAKLGFSQSYSYFTWRNSKAEFIAYMTELTAGPPREFFRPNFFVNTPDINPYFLQTSGRAGFLIRAALAATLSGLWGVYSGFELLEAEPIPGREEYLHSEKFQIRPRPLRAEGDIVEEISQLNRLRRAHPALQTHLNVEFFEADNEAVLYFGKQTPGAGDLILAAISFDPHHPQSAQVVSPFWRLGAEEGEALRVEDLLTGARFIWRGRNQTVHLDPSRPYGLWRLEREAGS